LTDAELEAVFACAHVLTYADRDTFLKALAIELAKQPTMGLL
jgi:hypothetical protein